VGKPQGAGLSQGGAPEEGDLVSVCCTHTYVCLPQGPLRSPFREGAEKGVFKIGDQERSYRVPSKEDGKMSRPSAIQGLRALPNLPLPMVHHSNQSP
jgi:hypothetical protein